MIIPKSIEIGPTRYTVKIERLDTSPHAGRIFYHIGHIRLNMAPRAQPGRLSHTFWHEVVHGILHDMGNPLRDDEKFVDGVAKRINQVVRTAKL